MGRSMGHIGDSDIKELVEDREEELTMDEHSELQIEQHKVLTEEQSSEEEEEREEIKIDVIKAIIEKWNECQVFFEKNHADKTVTNRVLNMMNDNVVFSFL